MLEVWRAVDMRGEENAGKIAEIPISAFVRRSEEEEVGRKA